MENETVLVKILFFAKARELAGVSQENVYIKRNLTVRDLRQELISQFGLELIGDTSAIAVNEEWVDNSTQLTLVAGDIVAFIPPLSGGIPAESYFSNLNCLPCRHFLYFEQPAMRLKTSTVFQDLEIFTVMTPGAGAIWPLQEVEMNSIKLSNEALDVGAIYASVCSADCGAVSLFVGTTRDTFMDRPVLRLEYEAYEPMAVKSLEALATQIRDKYDARNVAIHHRLGEVAVSDASVVIAVATPHRQASLQAVSFAIDQLKASVPIFKKELYADDNSSVWKSNSELEVVAETEEEQVFDVDPQLVQITASTREINRRIESFQKRKRLELDENNKRAFCKDGDHVDRENTCARVDAILVRQSGSKSHLKVHRVENRVGPQVQSFSPAKVPLEVKGGIGERVANAEMFLGLTHRQQNVFARLKAIEDRILFLETISPEYFHAPKQQGNVSGGGAAPAAFEGKKTLSAADLGKKVLDFEKKLQAKFVSN